MPAVFCYKTILKLCTPCIVFGIVSLETILKLYDVGYGGRACRGWCCTEQLRSKKAATCHATTSEAVMMECFNLPVCNIAAISAAICIQAERLGCASPMLGAFLHLDPLPARLPFFNGVFASLQCCTRYSPSSRCLGWTYLTDASLCCYDGRVQGKPCRGLWYDSAPSSMDPLG